MLHPIVDVEERPDSRLWVRCADGVEGEVDRSDLVGTGVFSAWENPDVLRSVEIDGESGTVVWPGDLDLAPDALQKELAPVATS